MACTITQADLGPMAAGLDPDVAAMFIASATTVLLGPAQCQAATQLAWLRCCQDPCEAVKLLAQHMIASDPASGAGSLQLVARRVGDVSRTYANVSSSSGKLGGTPYGQMLSFMLGRYELCRAERNTMPNAYGGCGCR